MLRQSTIAIVIGACGLLAWTTPLVAQLGEDRLYRSAYFLGRGDTGISIADEQDAIFYNPAGLAYGKGIYKKTVLAAPQIEVSASARDLVRRVGVEQSDAVETALDQVGKPNHIGAQTFTGIILRRAALGLWASNQLDLLVAKSENDGALDVAHASGVQNIGATFSLAESFWRDTLLLGITAKHLMRGRGDASVSAAETDGLKDQLSDTKKFYGFGQGNGADIGMQLRGSGTLVPAFGLTVSDIGDTHIEPSDETDLDLSVKQTINAGFSLEGGTKLSKFRLLADVRDIAGRTIKSPYKKLHFGGELTVHDFVGVTAGINQGYFTSGVYLDLYFVRMDLGTYTEEISDRAGARPDKRYYARVMAGF